MVEVNNLNDVLNYIDNGITDNNNKSHYILYISMIHDYFLDLEGIDFDIRDKLLKQSNLIITKLFDYENDTLRNEWLEMRNLIVPNLIENADNLDDDDKYFISNK